MFSIVIYVTSILFCIFLIGSFAIWYAVSALLQQLTLLSIAFLLLSAYPAYFVATLVVPAFVLAHDLKAKPRWRLLLFSTWGIFSIMLFTILPNPLIIAALHTLAGSALISHSMLFDAKMR